MRAYLRSERVAGVRKSAGGEDSFADYVDYVRARLAEDPHLWALVLYEEVVDLGYDKAYSTFTRQVRTRGLRPHCEPCAGTKGRPSTVIEHPPGEETQWDWIEMPDPPEHWGWGGSAYLLVPGGEDAGEAVAGAHGPGPSAYRHRLFQGEPQPQAAGRRQWE